MPITVRRRGVAAQPEPEGPSTLQRILAGATRVGAGVLATPVGMVPSPVTTSAAGAIGSLGELLAQRLEGSEPNFKRAMVEGGIAAVPFGKIIKGGRALQSAVRSGALSGAGEAGRELSMEGELDPASIGLTGLLGGVTGGILGKLTPPVLRTESGGAVKPKPSGPTAIGRLTRGGEVVKEAQLPTSFTPAFTKEPTTGELYNLLNRNISRIKPAPAATLEAISDLDKAIQQAGKIGLGIRANVLDDLVAEYKAAEQAGKLLGGEARASNKAFDDMLAGRQVEDMRKGLVPQPPTVTESYTAGPFRGTRKFTPPKPEKAPKGEKRGGLVGPREAAMAQTDEAADALDAIQELTGGAGARTVAGMGTMPAEAPVNLIREASDITGPVLGGMQVAGISAERPNDLAQLFKTRVGATGKNYRLAKEAEAAGEIPTSDLARQAHLREQAALRGEAPPVTTPTPEISPTAGDWIEEQSRLVDDIIAKQKASGTVLGSGFGGMQGIGSLFAKHPEFGQSLGLGAAGAVVGGVTDPFDNPIESAAAGFTAGAVAPRIVATLMNLGVPEGAVPTLMEQAKTPQGILNVVRTVGRYIPQYQRFNYLMDEQGLPANVFVGPYMSAVLGSLTKGLSGDKRGWAALQELSPTNFLKEMYKARDEAMTLVRSGEVVRGESELLGTITDPSKNPLTWPGLSMTTGDLGARRILMKHGFSDDEARIMTLTSEPELPAMRGLAETGKRSPFLQFLFPFRRTPANIAEQGAHRFPGLGLVTQSMRKLPDPLREQAVQQGLGLGFLGGGYVAGQSMDPETARVARRYLTNASGQYSLETALGLAAGQAVGRDQPIMSYSTARAAEQALPLPTADPLIALLTAPSKGEIPRGFIPQGYHRMLYPPDNTGASLRPITIRRRQ